MRFGIHLPQYGRAASAESIARAARQAEELGYDDVWVSDHLAVPEDAAYPPAFLYEPLITLTWAAAATEHVGLGTSVLVLPYRHPLHLAKELASLDRFSRGRLTVGVAAGWLRGEFEALGVPFEGRGERTDDAIDLLRACWGDQPVDHEGPVFTVRRVKVVPTPERTIPIWVGGTAEPALRRAIDRGDGWHGNFVAPADAAPVLKRLRSERPDEAFTLSMRLNWDGLATDHGQIRRDFDAYRAAGLQHVVSNPIQADLDAWLRSVETLWEVMSER